MIVALYVQRRVAVLGFSTAYDVAQICTQPSAIIRLVSKCCVSFVQSENDAKSRDKDEEAGNDLGQGIGPLLHPAYSVFSSEDTVLAKHAWERFDRVCHETTHYWANDYSNVEAHRQ